MWANDLSFYVLASTSFEIINYACQPHRNVARISLYRALRMLSMVVIFFSWNKNKAKTKHFTRYNPTLETTTHQQKVTHKHNEPRIRCLLLQVCLHRKNKLCFRVRLDNHLPSTVEWEMAESRGVAHGWQATHIALSPFTREQSWAGNRIVANQSRQLQQCWLGINFSEPFKNIIISVLKVK